MALLIRNESCRRHGDRWCRDWRCNPRCTYDRRQIEALLTANWNGGIVHQEEHIEAGMPRSRNNPALMGNTEVSLIDLRRALNDLYLPDYLLFLHYGQGWTHKHVAEFLATPLGTVQDRIYSSVTKIMHYLNGTEPEEES